jgi:putative ABC transport system permease protein
MSLINYIQMALKALIQNKVRTMLTLLGIIIGIGSVISLLALSNGATQSITGQLSSFGTNNVTLSPGASSGGNRPPGQSSSNGTLELEVFDYLENKLDTTIYDAILPSYSGQSTITYKNKTQNTSINGIDPNYFTYNTITIYEGRALTKSVILF